MPTSKEDLRNILADFEIDLAKSKSADESEEALNKAMQLIHAREEALQKKFDKQRVLERAGDRAIIAQLKTQLQSQPTTKDKEE